MMANKWACDPSPGNRSLSLKAFKLNREGKVLFSLQFWNYKAVAAP